MTVSFREVSIKHEVNCEVREMLLFNIKIYTSPVWKDFHYKIYGVKMDLLHSSLISSPEIHYFKMAIYLSLFYGCIVFHYMDMS